MPDQIFSKCSCLSHEMKNELTGVLNIAELMTHRNLQELEDQIKGVPKEKIPSFQKVSLEKLRHDIFTIGELRREIRSINTCQPKEPFRFVDEVTDDETKK